LPHHLGLVARDTRQGYGKPYPYNQDGKPLIKSRIGC
jgi:hypothetical protein